MSSKLLLAALKRIAGNVVNSVITDRGRWGEPLPLAS